MNITLDQLEQLYKNGYNLDMVVLLKMIDEGTAIKEVCIGSVKLELLYTSLIRKGLITSEDKITQTGKELLKFIHTTDTPKLVKKSKDSAKFDAWWLAYPSTDTFSYKNKVFNGTRSLKAKKDDCRIKLNKILDEGEYTIEELVKALEFEVLQKKENSLKTGENKLSYLQNSLTYLNQRTFESFIDLIREGIVIEEKQSYDGVNI